MLINPIKQSYIGWRVLIGAFIGASLGIGFSSALFGMFVIPVTHELGLTRSDYNTAYIVYMVANSVTAPIIGIMLDRLSVRWLIFYSGLVFGAMQILISQTTEIWVMLAAMVPLAVASTICGVVGANTIVVRWFEARRGRALGLLAISTSFGGLMSQPLTALLIDTVGWRQGLFGIGTGVAIIIPSVAFLLLRDRPSGLEPGYAAEFSAQSAQDTPQTSHVDRLTISQLLRMRNFWIMAIAVSLLFGADTAVGISQVAFFQDIGYPLSTVSLIVALKSGSSILGKLIIGYLADRVDLRWLYAFVALSSILLLSIYCSEPSLPVLIISVGLLGITVGGVYPIWSTMMAWLFGPSSFGTVMGMVSMIIPIFAIAAARYIGSVFDTQGTYIPGFMTFIGIILLSMLLIVFIKPPKNSEC